MSALPTLPEFESLNRSGLEMLASFELNDTAPVYAPTCEAYWRDPAPFDAAKVQGQTEIDALFASHEARWKAEQEARWAVEDAS